MSGMKSAYELAMERLGGESRTLNEEQKQTIADIDARTKARIAETEIMFDQQLAGEPDPASARCSGPPTPPRARGEVPSTGTAEVPSRIRMGQSKADSKTIGGWGLTRAEPWRA